MAVPEPPATVLELSNIFILVFRAILSEAVDTYHAVAVGLSLKKPLVIIEVLVQSETFSEPREHSVAVFLDFG